MTRAAPLLIAAALLCLAGCGDGSLVPAAGETAISASAASPTAATVPSATPTPAPSSGVAPTISDGASPPAGDPTTAPPLPPDPAVSSSGTASGGSALESVRRDVAEVAPELERFYQDREYPLDLAQVRSTLAEAGVSLSPGNTIAGYVYDGDAVEFELCVESTGGAFATYDTAPMTVGRSGASGGCQS